MIKKNKNVKNFIRQSNMKNITKVVIKRNWVWN